MNGEQKALRESFAFTNPIALLLLDNLLEFGISL